MTQTIISDPANLAEVRHSIEDFSQQCGFTTEAVGEIGLVVNEAIANIIRHAYGNATDRPIKLTADYSGDTLRIVLRDWGSGRDPSNCCGNDNPLKPGGVGLSCLRKLMDDVRFEPQPDGMELTLIRKNTASA